MTLSPARDALIDLNSNIEKAIFFSCWEAESSRESSQTEEHDMKINKGPIVLVMCPGSVIFYLVSGYLKEVKATLLIIIG